MLENQDDFYLGKKVTDDGQLTSEPLVLPSKQLMTHAVCVGMTGSGKTGLGIALMEEVSLAGIPSIIIDPKGDLANLLLAFPELNPQDFRPWVEDNAPSDADSAAQQLAQKWEHGLAEWGINKNRIAQYQHATQKTIYTPGSEAGIPLSVLASFKAPAAELQQDNEAFKNQILSTTASLLELLSLDTDPIKSKEAILIATIIETAWRQGRDLDLAALISQIQTPPFDKVGVLPVETYFPAKERLNLALTINNLLAAPGFQLWLQGVPLDIQSLLFTADNKPRQAIISIGHLSDPERMFLVTLLLNELISWMRQQPGTSRLRAVLSMDEIFGFFPPTSNPPSKLPMLMLLKQARAFGLGIVLSTQNPMDLDYKGLANCGTWFIGKLQTDRDRARVLEGLTGSLKTKEEAEAVEQMLTQTKNRVFLMHSIYSAKPVLFQTRWTECYLYGPLTLAQIAHLMKDQKLKMITEPSFETTNANIIIPSGVKQYTFKDLAMEETTPILAGVVNLHFVDSKNNIDFWQENYYRIPLGKNENTLDWQDTQKMVIDKAMLCDAAPTPSQLNVLPAAFVQTQNYSKFSKELSAFIYQHESLSLYCEADLNLVSRPEESKHDFLQRVINAIKNAGSHPAQSAEIKKIEEKICRAQSKLDSLQEKAGDRKLNTVFAIGKTIFNGLFSKRKINKTVITQAGSAIKNAGKINDDRQKINALKDEIANYENQMAQLANRTFTAENLSLQPLVLKPRKTDIMVKQIVILWVGR